MDVKVAGIQGIPIKDVVPTDGQVLTFVAVDSEWEPQSTPFHQVTSPLLSEP